MIFLFFLFLDEEEMQKVFSVVSNSSFSEIPLGHALQEVMEIVRRHQVKLSPQYSTLMVSIVIIEGIAKQLDSTLNLFSNAIFFEFLPHLKTLNDILNKSRNRENKK